MAKWPSFYKQHFQIIFPYGTRAGVVMYACTRGDVISFYEKNAAVSSRVVEPIHYGHSYHFYRRSNYISDYDNQFSAIYTTAMSAIFIHYSLIYIDYDTYFKYQKYQKYIISWQRKNIIHIIARKFHSELHSFMKQKTSPKCHDGVIKWKHFPRYWPFVQGIHRTPSFDVFFDLRLNKRLNKQSWSWWFETSWRSLWRHCKDTQQSLNFSLLFTRYINMWSCNNISVTIILLIIDVVINVLADWKSNTKLFPGNERIFYRKNSVSWEHDGTAYVLILHPLFLWY